MTERAEGGRCPVGIRFYCRVELHPEDYADHEVLVSLAKGKACPLKGKEIIINVSGISGNDIWERLKELYPQRCPLCGKPLDKADFETFFP